MNQQSSSKHVSGRQGKSWSDQSMNVQEKTVSGRSAEGAGAELEKRRVPAAPSVPEAAVKREIKVHQLRGLRVHHSLVELL